MRSGAPARIVLVGPRENIKGAVLVFAAGTGSELKTSPLQEHAELLGPAQLAEISCMQERLFGASELPAPQL
ncbi:MAG: hypothetical protein HYV26_09490 [Candidatus Hydrogenedentes bacterium]|nr:hypothetical protein [Candidatus Hydrogenedentota bacterium]MBI3119099.1 hypothetical protein [Candidatus Hydrogenedentota bacterium]